MSRKASTNSLYNFARNPSMSTSPTSTVCTRNACLPYLNPSFLAGREFKRFRMLNNVKTRMAHLTENQNNLLAKAPVCPSNSPIITLFNYNLDSQFMLAFLFQICTTVCYRDVSYSDNILIHLDINKNSPPSRPRLFLQDRP